MSNIKLKNIAEAICTYVYNSIPIIKNQNYDYCHSTILIDENNKPIHFVSKEFYLSEEDATYLVDSEEFRQPVKQIEEFISGINNKLQDLNSDGNKKFIFANSVDSELIKNTTHINQIYRKYKPENTYVYFLDNFAIRLSIYLEFYSVNFTLDTYLLIE